MSVEMELTKITDDFSVPKISYGSGMYEKEYLSVSCVDIMKQKLLAGKKWVGGGGELERYLTLKQIVGRNQSVMIDTSSAYGYAEKNLGNLLKETDFRQNKIICTKISSKEQMIYGSNIRKLFYYSLQRLQQKTIDIYLMHWPIEKNLISVWKQMEELYKEGYIRCIGVCNCQERQLDKILSKCDIKPMINQIECHPLYTREELRRFCAAENIRVMAYTPLARCDSRLFCNKKLNIIALKYKKTVSQIILRWHIENNNIPIFATGNIVHYEQNCDVFDFKLTEAEMNFINTINIDAKLRYDSENCDFLQL